MKEDILNSNYKYGFTTNIESIAFDKGLNEDVIKKISLKKNEPDFILDFRLKAFSIFKNKKEPKWANLDYPNINYQDISYFSEPKKKQKLDNLEEVDKEILKTLDRLGISIEEQKKLNNVATDIVFDSVSIGTTHKKKLEKMGIIFCPISEAIEKYPDLIKKYLGSVVPIDDNFFASLNSCVFSEGSFIYIPKNVKCPIELSTYFRINDQRIGQFERTLIIADENSYVSYLEGCSAPAHLKSQLHVAIVEIIALDSAEIKYSTVQNWYPGDKDKKDTGIYNFVTKRGLCKGKNSKISWTQVEIGSAITWKYPSCILKGDNSIGEFYSIALTNNNMQADTGTKMIHIGKNTKSKIISKSISADFSKSSYRGLVKMTPIATNAKNYTQCDSMIVGNNCSVSTFPTIISRNKTSKIEHEASTSKLSEDQIFYLQTKGFSKEEAIEILIKGFCQEVIKNLPFEFAIEAQKLLSIKLENSVG
ncbi:MAG: FeS cluster assembly protein SufB [Candidatus Anoxychlamydiales bacterium]|nr:FeS cluster assembly protein SufB [Candidatus Anoxychlamydiales bacterium]